VTLDVGGEVGRWDFDGVWFVKVVGVGYRECDMIGQVVAGASGALVATFLVEVAFVHDDGVVVVIDGDSGRVWKALGIIIQC
jgi:hypothetical protein